MSGLRFFTFPELVVSVPGEGDLVLAVEETSRRGLCGSALAQRIRRAGRARQRVEFIACVIAYGNGNCDVI